MTKVNGYNNHETAEFALTIENDEPTWNDLQEELNRLYDENPRELDMREGLTNILKSILAYWEDEAIAAVKVAAIGNRRNGSLGLTFALNALRNTFDAIDVSECAESWVANYLYNKESK